MNRPGTASERVTGFGDVLLAEIAAGVRTCVGEICKRFDLPPERAAPAVAVLLGEQSRVVPDEPLSLPFAAPELYVGRRFLKGLGRRETIVEFLRRVWGPYLAKKLLTRAGLRQLDPSADKAVENWLRQHELPPDIDLPSHPKRPCKKTAKINAVP